MEILAWQKHPFNINVSRPVRLKVSNKGKIQTSLDFVSTVSIVSNKKGISFYENAWRITEPTAMALYINFIPTFPNHEVAYGKFLALKPFYVRVATNSNLEMCCCKLHLHARWSIKVCTLPWWIVEEVEIAEGWVVSEIILNWGGDGHNKMTTREFYDFTVKWGGWYNKRVELNVFRQYLLYFPEKICICLCAITCFIVDICSVCIKCFHNL